MNDDVNCVVKKKKKEKKRIFICKMMILGMFLKYCYALSRINTRQRRNEVALNAKRKLECLTRPSYILLPLKVTVWSVLDHK